MPHLLTLRGRHALSPFRVAKLVAALAASRPDHAVAGIAATYWHFVEVERDLAPAERATLERLLTYGPHDDADGRRAASCSSSSRGPERSRRGRRRRPTSRGTAASTPVARIERGVGYRVATRDGAPLAAADRAALLPLLHDRMTEAVLPRLEDAQALFAHFPPRPLATIPLLARGRAAIEAANAALGLALAPDEIDYLDASFRRIGPRSDRRRADDVRAGELRALPAQDLQRRLDRSTACAQPQSLFAMIRHTHAASPQRHGRRLRRQRGGDGGRDGAALLPGCRRPLRARTREPTHILMKVETHNHPTAIAPFPGAATGSGGEIRDEGATGRGAKPKAGLTGFTVSHLRLPGLPQPWEAPYGKPDRIASALDIMLEGPIGGASFNNEFGRPNLLGYFRTFEQEVAGEVRGYHKPIMIAGGVGNIRADHTHEARVAGRRAADPARRPGHADRHGRRRGVVDGDRRQHRRPRFRFGAARQRRDAAPRAGGDRPLLAARAPRIRSCRSTTSARAACRTRCRSSSTAAARAPRFDLRAVPSEEPGMAPREIWCNEAQERYVLAIAPADLERFRAICERERCPFAVVGTATGEGAPRRRRSAFRQRAGRHGSRRAARQAAEDDARRRRTCARALRPLDLGGVDRQGRGVPRAAAAGGRRQDVPRHDRRSHRRRALRARSDGRPVAGAGRRRRGDADGFRRLRRRSDGDGRAHAARADRRAGVGPHGGRRGDHQHRRRGDRASRRRQALGELDGAGRPSRRGRRALRHRARGGDGALPGARHQHSGRQGLDVDAHDVARRAASTRRSPRRCR